MHRSSPGSVSRSPPIVAAPAFAGPGDLDTTFSGDGVKTVDYVGSSDTFYGVAVHGNAPTTCGVSASQATLTAFTAGGAFNMSFSGDGKWRQNILGHGYTTSRRAVSCGTDGSSPSVVPKEPTGTIG